MEAITFLGVGTGNIFLREQLLSSGGIILKLKDLQFHIDPGTNSLLRLYRSGINPRETTSVFCSHAHLNHYNDVNAVIDAMTLSGLDKKGILVLNKDVIEKVNESYLSYLEKFIGMESGKKIAIEDIEVTALKAEHSSSNIGFKFITPEFILSYSSDTKYFEELADGYEDSDILILNNKNPFNVNDNNNLNSDDSIKIINEVKPKLAIITHFGIKMIKEDTLYQAREICKKTRIQVIAAKDGMSVNHYSFSTTIKT